MIEMAKYVTSKMLMEGYSLEIIAGFVGNIVNEGKFWPFLNRQITKPEKSHRI